MTSGDGQVRGDEQDLVQQVQEGNLEAFGGLMNLHAGRLRGYVSLAAPVPHLVDEIAHETFVFAYRHLHEFQRGTSFFQWLKSIAWNLLRCETQRFSRDRAHRRAYFERRLQEAESRQRLRPGSPKGELLEKTLERIPPEAREVLDLRYCFSMSMKEIAKRLGRTEAAIRTTLCRLRRQLRDQLKVTIQEPEA